MINDAKRDNRSSKNQEKAKENLFFIQNSPNLSIFYPKFTQPFYFNSKVTQPFERKCLLMGESTNEKDLLHKKFGRHKIVH